MYYVPVDTGVSECSLHFAHCRFIRGAHFFGANAMATMVFAHTLRVFYTGSSYQRPQLMWVSGVLAMFLTMAMAFSGYLLMRVDRILGHDGS